MSGFRDEGKDPFELQQLGQKTKLQYIKNQGWDNVILRSSNCCEDCKKLNNKVYKTDDAITELPIPHRLCKIKLRKKDKYPYCLCYFAAHLI
jgi:hypothetical protein